MLSLQAQETTFWGKVNNLLTKRALIDTTRLYQPKPCFSLGVFATGQQAGFDARVNFTLDMEEQGHPEGVSTYNLKENLCTKVGLDVGYGNVNLGYGLEVGPRSAWKRSAFMFNVLGKSWGLHLNYFKITNPFTSGLTLGNEDDEFYTNIVSTSDEVASLRNFTLDGYYVFNNKRFAYPAAYKMSLVQRRTAGSWMLTARYMQGDLYNSPEAAAGSYILMDCFASLQASFGGGYSVNFVLWHKDPVGPRDEKLRNITLNLTAMPVITAINFQKATFYDYDENGELIGKNVSKIWSYPTPNLIASAAGSITMGRLYFSTQFTYNRFYSISSHAFNASSMNYPEYVDDLSFRNVFHDWMVKGLLVYRF